MNTQLSVAAEQVVTQFASLVKQLCDEVQRQTVDVQALEQRVRDAGRQILCALLQRLLQPVIDAGQERLRRDGELLQAVGPATQRPGHALERQQRQCDGQPRQPPGHQSRARFLRSSSMNAITRYKVQLLHHAVSVGCHR
jgi:hypothetical protein